MNISGLSDLISLNPFKNMNKIKINLNDNCVLGNRCFVKVDKVRFIPYNSVETSKPVMIRGCTFTLPELLYSPFHFQQPQIQYLMPSFVLYCIEEANKNKSTSKYCIIDKNTETDELKINIFVPTFLKSVYVIIGLRIKHFWSSKFKIE
ncbi:hypothetical protein [Tanapox virus]|uniref:Uncharacterized protein 29L n=2 Tax=Tanapox virus TaxID=99000 RepID=A7XCE2_9POXV|nr:29L protein [Yaba-like disease virus]ABQ43503.1 hypothetical protein [Tanapox virus]ABQ43658.1 hypothetical protein [Tanapox virus]CAC21267.1 29L protein [Yaba-like disease virus]